jgi:signal peptidase I
MRRDPDASRRSTLRRVANLLGTIALLALVPLLWPTPLGGAVSYVQVNGESMEPTMHKGDVALLRRQSSYGPGDIVAYRIRKGEVGEGADVIHRIVGGDARHGFVTRGDNNDSNDPWHPKPEDILGRRWFLLPRAGAVFGLMHSRLAVAIFAGLMGAFAFLQIAAVPRRRTGKHEDPGDVTDRGEPFPDLGPDLRPDLGPDLVLDLTNLERSTDELPGLAPDAGLPRISWSADDHEPVQMLDA